MKNLQEHVQDAINEARNLEYRASLLTNSGKNIDVTIIIDSARDAKIMDEWLEDQIDNTIMHADGGPNEIEL